MAHWAEIDEDNVVIRVLVGSNDEPDEGYQWLIDNLGGTWIKTSYNNNIRKNFAGIGFFYDEERDAFISPKPFESWILDEETCKWKSPIEKPSDKMTDWNEELQTWIDVPKPFGSWKYDEDLEIWVSRVPIPQDGKQYTWDEESLSWIEI